MKIRKRRALKRAISVCCLLLGNLIFFLTIWLASKYDRVSLDQFIYQLKTSSAGANRSLLGSAYVRVGLFGFLLTGIEIFSYLLLTGALPSVMKRIVKNEATRGKIRRHKICRFMVRHVMPLGMIALILGLSFFTVMLNIPQYVSGTLSDSSFIGENYADPNKVALTFPEEKRNLIYIFLESLENTFGETAAGGPITDNFMPELSELAETNINFSNDNDLGGAMTATGATWTAAAMVTQTSGLIVQVPLDATSYGGDNPYMPGVVSIGEILAKEGYSNTLLVGSNADFADRDDYFQDHGNFHIIDTESLKAEGRLEEDYRVWWGFEDEKLFAYAKEELTRLAAMDQPFNFTMLTCDTHFPDGYVCRLCGEDYEDQYPNVVRCSSKQVLEFIQWIQQQPFYENTTIVLSGDHLTMDPDFMKEVEPTYQRTIYNCFINAKAVPVKEKNRLFGPYDMYPTTLAAMGVSIKGDRLGLGTNLFSSLPTITEKYGYELLEEEFNKSSEYYNKKFLGMEK